MLKSRKDVERVREKAEKGLNQQKVRAMVCAGTGCLANGSLKVYEKLRELVSEKGLLVDLDMTEDACGEAHPNGNGIGIAKSGCHGFCQMGPLVRIEPQGILYVSVKPEDVEEIVEETLIKGKAVTRLLYQDSPSGTAVKTEDSIPFYKRQHRVVLANCGRINPEDIREAIAMGGYHAIAKALDEMTPDQVIQLINASGLRGRGGAGFPTGRKWGFAQAAKSVKKYVICNGDEGDPGAFMDRSVMEGDPHKVIEGLMIAAFAIGADEGFIYVRAEYPVAVTRLKKAIKEAREYGLLGRNILGSDFSFDITIKEGAGAFVCGEETALISSIEGRRGMPNPRPPYPAAKGLFGKPTIINNVETLSNLPSIILNGPAWFKSHGTETSPGTKTFALAGQVVNTGLVEVPMGFPLRDLVFEVGGGTRTGREFKAVQIGGPSGGCLAKDQLDVALDYESLRKVGAMVGSGGIVVMDEDTCMVEVARFFMQFAQNESCGKCVPCREGTKQMLALLTKITNGEGTEEDLELLEEVALAVKDGALCGLGKTAPNPVLTTLKYFRSEYEAHVLEKRCPAGVCQALKAYSINPDKCRGCTLCAKACPVGAISGERKKPHNIDQAKCIKCNTCVEKCRFGAISKE
ncbi:MAG TPA: NADH-quinone oxidoreductase subunit NuoF [Firmicutes bacterium]|nr:NADH-quinone oxidoreductase subunit NuoF [Bacillota bacterium]